MKLMILGHIMGDFYLQTNKIVEQKRYSFLVLLLHSILYGLVVCAAFYLMNIRQPINLIIIGLILLVSHLIIDKTKMTVEKKAKSSSLCFIIDQLAHAFIILILAKVFRVVDGGSIDIGNYCLSAKFVMTIIAVLMCWKPAAIFIAKLFETLFSTNDSIGKQKESKNIDSKKEKQIRIHDVRTGYWIGVLEREIILILGILGQYGAIGFVLTAKSLARYKQLEKKEFAEKYLIGTLTSALIAFVCIWLLNNV